MKRSGKTTFKIPPSLAAQKPTKNRRTFIHHSWPIAAEVAVIEGEDAFCIFISLYEMFSADIWEISFPPTPPR